jgi:hypothetical protein
VYMYVFMCVCIECGLVQGWCLLRRGGRLDGMPRRSGRSTVYMYATVCVYVYMHRALDGMYADSVWVRFVHTHVCIHTFTHARTCIHEYMNACTYWSISKWYSVVLEVTVTSSNGPLLLWAPGCVSGRQRHLGVPNRRVIQADQVWKISPRNRNRNRDFI